MNTGIHRLAIFSAITAATSIVLFFSYMFFVYATPDYQVLRYFIIVCIFALIAAGAAYVFIRGLGWVCSGFRRRPRSGFTGPNYN